MPEIRSTYRLQFHGGFGFDQAAAICCYLRDLGITHIYCSPILQAVSGSTHGYDVVDPGHVDEELGGEAAFRRFAEKAREAGLGLVLDIVPNHMAIGSRKNIWWWDVLENGPSSPYSSYFDIGWQASEEKLRMKILTPVLGDHYGRVLSAGQIRAEREGGSFVIRYYDHVFPAAPGSMAPALAVAARRIQSEYLAFLADSLSRLPVTGDADLSVAAERYRDKEVVRGLLTRLCDESQEVAQTIDAVVEEVNRNPDALDAVLEQQHYRLSYWRTAARDVGYRRFFDINTLVGVRVERPHVFDETHRLILQWVREGLVDGLRVDHPDGLRDPEDYFARLHDAAPGAWIVAEKILSPGELSRRSWKIAGTTGYDFLNVAAGLFIDARGQKALTGLYREFTGETESWREVALKSKDQVLRNLLGSDLNRLTAIFVDICEHNRDNRDFTRHEIHEALREAVTCFAVYRSYVRAEAGQCGEDDAGWINRALDLAKERRPDLDPGLIKFLRSLLLLETRGRMEAEFVMQFQQFTSPVMAKGVEDTAFYNYTRFLALNEVGGDPGQFGVTPDEFHAWCQRTERDWPRTMLASATHDTKRGEDVRVRLGLLSEIPELWAATASRWAARNEGFKSNGLPGRNTEYLLYQTLVGAWPIKADRLQEYMRKAVREAKRESSWTSPNAAAEKALETFIAAIMTDRGFLEDARSFIEPLILPGRIGSLARTLIKLTAPGIPDTYRGTETWDLTLVDPDNRRPVDFDLRQRLLASLGSMKPAEVMARMEEGIPKLWVITRALRLRPKLGPYAPLAITGGSSNNAIAFARGDVITVVPRLLIGSRAWAETAVELPGRAAWRNVMTGEEIPPGRTLLSHLFAGFPVALLDHA